MFPDTENCRSARWRIATNTFKNGRTVVDHVRHHVHLGVIPGNQFPVVPDFFSRLNRHGGEAPSEIDCAANWWSRFSLNRILDPNPDFPGSKNQLLPYFR